MTHIQTLEPIKDNFKLDILEGLSKEHKRIPSKYFYDEHGSELFTRITSHPDYYLTRCELEILKNPAQIFGNIIGEQYINLVELGPGEGIKAAYFIKYFLQKKMRFSYMPIDISRKYLQQIIDKFSIYKGISLLPLQADYLEGLKSIQFDEHVRNLVLFLGANIGNYSLSEAALFLKHLKANLQAKDFVLIGFDIRKNLNHLMRAYDDSEGLTREFNLNLLRRINKAFDGNFNVNQFMHYPTYNPYQNAMESYLISLEPQKINLKNINKIITFDAFEAIHVESSYKYSFAQIETLAANSGYKVVKHFTDAKGYFADSLWQVNS